MSGRGGRGRGRGRSAVAQQGQPNAGRGPKQGRIFNLMMNAMTCEDVARWTEGR